MGYCHTTQPSPITILPLLYLLLDLPISPAFYSIDQNYDHDLLHLILLSILASVINTKARNAAVLVGQKWLVLERGTQTSLTLRGNVVHSNLYMILTCFQAVTHLDLSLLSPWGHSFISPSSDPTLLAHLLRHAFPMVTSLTVYACTPATLQLLAPQWPNLTRNSHFVHQTITAGDGAYHSSSSPPFSSSRSPSSGGDGGETSSAGHGSGGESANRSNNPHLHSFISS